MVLWREELCNKKISLRDSQADLLLIIVHLRDGYEPLSLY
jgi:hypothetical protein